MVAFCIVFGCSNRSSRDTDVKYYRLPSEIIHQGKTKRELTIDRKRWWLSAIRLESRQDFKPWDRICSKHFVSGKKADLYDSDNVDWVPTLHMGHDNVRRLTQSAEARRKRAKRRERDQLALKASTQQSKEQNIENISLNEKEADAVEVLMCMSTQHSTCRPGTSEFGVEPQAKIATVETQTEFGQLTKSLYTQTELTGKFFNMMREDMRRTNEELYKLREKVSENNEVQQKLFEHDNERVKYYTGLSSFLVLSAVFDLISPYISQTHRSQLDRFQQMMVVLMRLRLNLSEQDLAYRFKVSQSTISRTFRSTLNTMYTSLKHMIIWPDREFLRKTMPMQFRKEFGQKVAVIIDCFEIFIERPSNLLARAQTWSQYKHHNTIKYLIGITPQGSTSFISKGWGGRTSDKVITEESGFLDKLDPGDIILADRGFTISESVAVRGAYAYIPAFTRGHKQLSPADVDMTRKIANVRIHVERVIGATRQKYTILNGPVPIDLLISDSHGLTLMDQVVKVCYALNNLNPSIVDFQ